MNINLLYCPAGSGFSLAKMFLNMRQVITLVCGVSRGHSIVSAEYHLLLLRPPSGLRESVREITRKIDNGFQLVIICQQKNRIEGRSSPRRPSRDKLAT